MPSKPHPTGPDPIAATASAAASASAGGDPADPGGWFLQLLDRRPTPCWLVGSDGRLVEANPLARRMVSSGGIARHLSDLLLDPDGRGALEHAWQQPDCLVRIPVWMRGATGEVHGGCLMVGRLGSTPFGRLRVVSFEADGPAAWRQSSGGGGAAMQPQQGACTGTGTGAADASAAEAVIAASFATLGHEIRTPLNAVMGFAELLRRDVSGLGEPLRNRCLGYLKRIADAGGHLLSISNELLDPANRTGHPGASGAQRVSLSTLFDAAQGMTQHQFSHHQVRLSLEPDGRTLQVRADLRRCTQVLCNLLTNAAKYTPAGGRATLSARRVAGAVRIAVTDNGLGIDRAGQARLFQPYERLGAHSEPVEGHGLGLFVSHQLVTAMNGRIGCLSEPGAGAEFWFELPAA